MPYSVRTAIQARLLATSAVTTLLATPSHSVFHRRAPQQAKPPLIVFDRRSGVKSYSFSDPDAVLEDTWLVRAVSFGRTADRAEEIAAAIDAALTDAPLSLSDRHLLAVFQESIVDYPEQVGKEMFQHCGGIYRVVTQPS